MLTVIETHPVQYHAPVYRTLQEKFNIPLTVIYGSDFSIAGYRDREFGASFSWDSNLLSGYRQIFLSNVVPGDVTASEKVSSRGLGEALGKIATRAILLVGYSSRYDQAGIIQALKSRQPILFRGETTDHALPRSRAKAWVRDAALRYFYQRCAKLLYIGAQSKHHYMRLGCPPEKLIFSPYCVDTDPFEFGEQARTNYRSNTRRELDIDDSKLVLLFSGKLSFRKGPDLLIRAVKELPENIQNRIVILFLGSGQLENDLQMLGRSYPTIKVLFLGFQNQTQLSRYYHAADMLVLPSRYSETWGLVVNEAMHHGLPCIVSSAVGSASDLIKPGLTGEVFEADKVESLVASIESMILMVDRTDVQQACRNVIEGYTVERAAEGIAGAYRQAIEL